jgi:germination protein M
MLKKIIIKRVILTTCVVFALGLLYLIPKNESQLSVNQKLEYTSKEVDTHTVFLLDSNNYVAMTSVMVQNKEPVNLARELLEVLITEGTGESKIPSGFKSIIPEGTVINNLSMEDGLMKVDLSNTALDVREDLEEKMVESIVYTLTSIKDVKKVMLFINGEVLSRLPKSDIVLPSTLDRSYGINKKYNFMSLDNLLSLTIYYVNEYNDKFYYVPVTEYVNDNRDKISIIVDELSSNSFYNSDLMSFLSKDAKLLSSQNDDHTLKLEFNDAIFSDMDEKNILEEVVYSISLSAFDNCDATKVIFMNNNKEILSKSLE